MSDHKYRQETQAKETDQPPKTDDSLYKTPEEDFLGQVEYRKENKVTVTDQTKKTDSEYEEYSEYKKLGE